MNQFTEKKLLYKILVHKDANAFAKLYDAYITPLYKFVYYKVSDKTVAEDVVSNVFLKIWKYLTQEKAKQKTIQNFRALLYSIARRSVVDYYREKNKSKEIPIEFALNIEDTTMSNMDILQDYNSVLQNLKKLKDEYQEIIILRYVQELSLKEIGVILEKNASSVRVTLHRAIKKLQSLTEEKK